MLDQAVKRSRLRFAAGSLAARMRKTPKVAYTTDHVEVVPAFHPPLPARRPDEVQWVRAQADDAGEDEEWRQQSLFDVAHRISLHCLPSQGGRSRDCAAQARQIAAQRCRTFRNHSGAASTPLTPHDGI